MLCKIIKQQDEGETAPQTYIYPTLPVTGGAVVSERRSAASQSSQEPSRRGSSMLPNAKLITIEEAAYQRGVCDTEARFQEQLAAISTKVAQALERSMAELGRFQKQLIVESEKQVAKLAIEIAKKIVRREVRIDDQIILAMIKVALSYVGDARKMRIRVNPEDLQVVRQSLPQMTDFESAATAPELIGDPAVERGGFVIESDAGMVDARLGQQFQEIEKSFFGNKP